MYVVNHQEEKTNACRGEELTIPAKLIHMCKACV
jgi:hypothetical protein